MTGEALARLARIVLCAALLPRVAPAHEFWIEPERYALDGGAAIVATLKVGQEMHGSEFPYLSGRFHRFTVTTRTDTRAVTGTEGDIPALTWRPLETGLHVIVYHSVADLAHHDSWDTFTRYLDKEGLEGIAAAHRARGLSEVRFNESYTRYAKALVQVGPASDADADSPLGLELELLLEPHPYADDDAAQASTATLLWRGAPLEGAQLTVFRRRETVTRATARTDADGRVTLPLRGPGEYLLNAVHMEPVEGASVVWHSHWASMTFRVGEP